MGIAGVAFLALMLIACVGTLPWSLGRVPTPGRAIEFSSPRYDDQHRSARHLPPFWAMPSVEIGSDTAVQRLRATAEDLALEHIAFQRSPQVTVDELHHEGVVPTEAQITEHTPKFLLGTDLLGRSVLVRCLAGGGISLAIGLAAAALSVFLGTFYGGISGYVGGRLDATMMRIVDVLYGLPYILLVVLIAVAMDALVENRQVQAAEAVRVQRDAWAAENTMSLMHGGMNEDDAQRQSRTLALVRFGSGELNPKLKQVIGLVTLLVAIGGVSWLTMARVVRGQVLSLKSQPFVEAARAMGVSVPGIFLRHLLPNLLGPILVYATLTVPQAVLQESFLSFLGIGVKPPLPSWGNLAAEGVVELNPYKSNWWLLAFPCLLLGSTLLALNFVGEGLREALDPRRARR